jgi:hypothetical protein
MVDKTMLVFDGVWLRSIGFHPSAARPALVARSKINALEQASADHAVIADLDPVAASRLAGGRAGALQPAKALVELVGAANRAAVRRDISPAVPFWRLAHLRFSVACQAAWLGPIWV